MNSLITKLTSSRNLLVARGREESPETQKFSLFAPHPTNFLGQPQICKTPVYTSRHTSHQLPMRKIPVCDCQFTVPGGNAWGGFLPISESRSLSLESPMRTSLCHLPDRSLEGWHLQVVEHRSVLHSKPRVVGGQWRSNSSSALQLPSMHMFTQAPAQPVCSLYSKLLRGFEEKAKS